MIFNITFIEGARLVGSDTYRGSLDVAKAIVIATVDGGSAEEAKIHDVNNTLPLHYTKAIRPL